MCKWSSIIFSVLGVTATSLIVVVSFGISSSSFSFSFSSEGVSDNDFVILERRLSKVINNAEIILEIILAYFFLSTLTESFIAFAMATDIIGSNDSFLYSSGIGSLLCFEWRATARETALDMSFTIADSTGKSVSKSSLYISDFCKVVLTLF